MNTKLLMRTSSGFMGLLGLAATFMPQEIIGYLGAESSPLQALAVQIMGALYLGFAFLNWMAQGNLIGGIYSRPVAIGNLTHFTVAALALLKAVISGLHEAPVIFGAVSYVTFAALFAWVVFGNPIAAHKNEV